MTGVQARETGAALIAWAEGKEIECRCVGFKEWASFGGVWDLGRYEYRIKPQPREWWIVRAPSYGDVVVSSEESAKEHVRNYCRTNAEIIHVREVI